MQYKLSILFITFFTFFSIQAQEKTDPNIQLIKDFIQQVSIDTISPDVILSQHILLKETSTNEEYDYLEASIEEIRLNLQTKNIDEIEYLTFNSLPKKETNNIDLEGKAVDQIYFLKYKKRQMLAIYIAENKIASFTLVVKENNKAQFITY